MQQLSQIIDFNQIKTEKDANNAFKSSLDYINYSAKGESDKETAKRRSHEFLKLINYHLVSEEASPISKFYTLFVLFNLILQILKVITQKDERTILSVLSNHSLLRYLVALAKSTDPQKPMQQKGKKLFSDSKIGNDYIRLVLESIKIWGERFSSNKKNQSSHFKKAYDELVKMKVVMPKELKFYDRKIFLPSSKNSRLTAEDIVETSISQKKSTQIVVKQPPKQAESQNSNFKSNKGKIMQYDIAKIEEFIAKLEENEYRKHCHEYHKLFEKQKEKYESIIHNLISSNNENQLQTALAINEFYVQQSEAYKKFLTNSEDYYSYVNLIQLKADELVAATRKTPQVKEVFRKEVTVQVKQRKNNLIDNPNNPNTSSNQQNILLVSNLKSQLNQKSQLQAKSFRNIKDSLSQDKSLGRTKRSISGFKKSSISKFSKSATKSRIALIFSHPPNPYPQDKRYQGDKIQANRDLQRTIKQVSKNQGLRRFITSNFKSKNPLFENAHLQIGFKSEAVYEEVNEFWAVLSIELFIGNMTDSEIINLSIEYKGETNMLLYGNPKIIQSSLSAGFQTKQELLIAPLDNKPSLIKMYLRYEIHGSQHEEKIILPNSVIKFIENEKLPKKEFVQHWNTSTIFKTDQFKLSRYSPPDSMSKYMVGLEELTPYEKFLEPGSETDFELGCQVVLKKKYEGVLRISIRPNLNAVIQIGVISNNQEAYEGLVYYAQTLKMILTDLQSV